MDLNTFLYYSIFILIILVVFTLPILYQISKLLGSVIRFIDSLNISTKALLTETTSTITNANSIIKTVDDMLVVLKDLIASLKELGEGAKKLGLALKDSEGYMASFFKYVVKFLISLKATLTHFAKGEKNKGGNSANDTKQ
ncbi:MAG: DUF948 domain-containing protein [Candidatus Magnetoovum sp. WYHC-5]|nr:DUF948 domain-containing protein [Candidatus Magnetoovum sp. WYHC-5]